VKVGVEGDDNTLLPACKVQYLRVRRSSGTDIADVHRVNVQFTEQSDCRAGQTLIE